jgi:hypothetical protein
MSCQQTLKYKTNECIICLESFEKDFTPLTPCNHYIHQECIAKTGKLECPLCRNKITLDEKYKQTYDEAVSNHLQEKMEEDRECAMDYMKEYIRDIAVNYVNRRFLNTEENVENALNYIRLFIKIYTRIYINFCLRQNIEHDMSREFLRSILHDALSFVEELDKYYIILNADEDEVDGGIDMLKDLLQNRRQQLNF